MTEGAPAFPRLLTKAKVVVSPKFSRVQGYIDKSVSSPRLGILLRMNFLWKTMGLGDNPLPMLSLYWLVE